jgi:hypothetical protein
MKTSAQSLSPEEQYAHLREVVLPVLAQAAIGRFDVDVPLKTQQSPELMELLSGVQMLLEVIRQQQQELIETRQRMTDILDEVLERSLDEKVPERVRSSRGRRNAV